LPEQRGVTGLSSSKSTSSLVFCAAENLNSKECFLRGWHHLSQHQWGKKPDNEVEDESRAIQIGAVFFGGLSPLSFGVSKRKFFC